jgi:epoxyqueuosine reductase
MLGMSYHQPKLRQQALPTRHGRVASYALGEDYHPLLWGKLNQLTSWLGHAVSGSHSRGVVDTAPLLERDFARLAGLGWFGKNTMLINKRMGSFLLLAAIVTTIELEIDPPHLASHCGSCTACLDACPTQAFPEPGLLDAGKCISYFTIEKRGSIPVEDRTKLGDWLFGCDICQDVCPWNRKALEGQEPRLLEAEWHTRDASSINLIDLLKMNEPEFRRLFRNTALWRAKRQGLLRNACLVLGNQGDATAKEALQAASASEDAVVKEAAQWAIAQIKLKTGLLSSAGHCSNLMSN